MAKRGCEHNLRKQCAECRRARERATKKARYAANKERFCQEAKDRRDSDPVRAREIREKYRADPENRAVERNLKLKGRGVVFAGGVTFSGLLAMQENCCAICEQPFEKTPHLDHDHALVGVPNVRGLICRPCNLALGLFRDNVKSLKRAVAYLESPPAENLLRAV